MPDETRWTWVRDPDTGHQFDVPADALDAGHVQGVEVVAGRPSHTGRSPRPPKHHVRLDGTPATPATAPVKGK